MSSIHQSSIDYLVELDGYLTRLGEGQDMPASSILVIQKIKRTLESHALNNKSVAEIEKVVTFIEQARSSDASITLSDGRTLKNLASSISQKLSPILHRILQLKDMDHNPKGKDLHQRVNDCTTRLRPDGAASPKKTLKTMVKNLGTTCGGGVAAVFVWVSNKTGLTETALENAAGNPGKLRTDLDKKTTSFAGSEAADQITELVLRGLKDLTAIEEYEPVARPEYAQALYERETFLTNNPQLSPLGETLKALTTVSADKLQLFINGQVLQGMNFIVDLISRLSEQANAFPDYCLKAMKRAVFALEKKSVGKEAQAAELLDTFTKELTKLILQVAFPKGAESLLGLIPTETIRERAWNVIAHEIEKALGNAINGLLTKNDLFEKVLLQINDTLRKEIATPPKERTPVAAPAAPKKTPESYPKQEEFNSTLSRISDFVIDMIPSKFLRFIARRGVHSRIDKIGSAVVNALQGINLVTLFNDECKKFTEAQKSTPKTDGGKKTRKELEEIEAEAQRKEADKERRLKDVEKELAQTIDLAIALAAKEISGVPAGETIPSRDTGQQAVQQIKNTWKAFTSSCIHMGLHLTTKLLRIKPTLVTSYRNVKALKIEPFLNVINNFLGHENK